MADKLKNSRGSEPRQEIQEKTNGTRIFRSEKGRREILAFYEDTLRQWPLPAERGMIPTRHGDTFFITSGAEKLPPLVCIHGSASNSAMWMGSITTLARHFRVYALDLPGEPGLSAPLRHDLSGSEPAQWLQDILDHLGTGEVSLLGCSLGGWMTLKCAAAMPERVTRTLLLTSAGAAMPRPAFVFRILPFLFMGSYGVRAINRLIWQQKEIPPEVNEFSLLISKHFIPRVHIPLLSDKELSRLTMPVKLIAGDRDPMLHTKKTIARLERLLPRFSSQVVPGTGHVIINQEDSMLKFLRTNP